MTPEKYCPKCGLPQPLNRFPLTKATGTYGSPCKACHARAAKAFRQRHADRLRPQERERSATRNTYIRTWQVEHPLHMRAAQRRHRLKAAPDYPGPLQKDSQCSEKPDSDPKKALSSPKRG